LVPPSANSHLDFRITPKFELSQLGHPDKTGDAFTFEVTLLNKQPESALGMGISIIRIPSCLEINFNLLDDLMRDKVFDYYEVRHANTEIVFYWRQFAPSETKTFNLDML